MLDRLYTVSEIAETLSVDSDKVLRWIASKEIEAIDVATFAKGGKPQWRISPQAISAFLASRSTSPTKTQKQPSRTPVAERTFIR